ncbi:hypothetical protein AAFF_G00018660 [Aldrovandia affinis]|uniref:Beta/gamma crystallin 'Greek key' domain-containing protein n=1 Tax=Aldrovandia affinis TaxID=143900 RepID=A0AAD7S5A5_9TELE|nr:hypothetical protein AAFF_G00018660 [Aldrovandia affinis]
MEAVERPSYMGCQYVLYPEYQHWVGFKDSIRSYRTFSYLSSLVTGGYHDPAAGPIACVYERPDFQGQMMDFSDDCESVQDHFRSRDINSCNVAEGYWTLYEHPSHRGRHYFLRPGRYRKCSDWGAICVTTGSFHRVTDF